MARHTRETLRIQARLDRALIEHLRAWVDENGPRLSDLEQAARMADDAADMWQRAYHDAIEHAPDVHPSLTLAGDIVSLKSD